jgi:hypothetical protein
MTSNKQEHTMIFEQNHEAPKKKHRIRKMVIGALLRGL